MPPTYRPRATARQIHHRTATLRLPSGDHAHHLSPADADAGHNFLLRESFDAAVTRAAAGKGVARRTFENMLSSQAMCFNVFAPLATRLDLASELFAGLVPGVSTVTSITLEHTPDPSIFGDQAGLAGVDCDLLVEGTTTSGNRFVLVVETKFVEREFSVCGFRKPGRADRGQAVCPDDVPVATDRHACLYASRKGYRYWQRSDELGVLAPGAVPPSGCPFASAPWQLWTQLTLAHAEAQRRGATEAHVAVCTSARNTTLLGDNGEVLDGFRALVAHPDRVHLLDLDLLLERLSSLAPPELTDWTTGLSERYAAI